jgi:Holliday junction resolvasome RuvABC DNA-binding subunit
VANGAQAGARLGLAITQMAQRVREGSLARTTPALSQMVARVADQEAGARAEAARVQLLGWLKDHGLPVRPDGELSGLLGAIGRAGGWMLQQTLSTAIGFGIGQAMAAVLEPYFLDMAKVAWATEENRDLAPAELAALAAQGWIPPERLADEARNAGLSPERSALLRRLAEVQMGVAEVLELLRRGVIDEAEADRRLHHAGFGEESRAHLLRLRIVIPSIEEALTGWLEGQIDEAEARRRFLAAGGDPEWFQTAYNIRGEAPTPTQLLDLLNRGIVPERGTGPEALTYEQGFLEGPWRNKWLEPFLALAEYRVPPRSVVPMYRSGAIDEQYALELLTKSGLSATDAEAMLAEASANKLVGERELVKGELLGAYGAGLLDPAATLEALGGLGYEPDEAELLLAIADAQYEKRLRDASATRIGNLYKARRIDEGAAAGALEALGYPGTASAKALAVWDVERELATAELTEAQMRAAWGRGVVDEPAYLTWLGDHGYSDDEARILVETYRPTGATTGRDLTEAQARAAWKAGVFTEDEYRTRLEELGYDPAEVETLVQLHRPEGG